MWSLLAVLVSDFRWCFALCLFIILLVQFGLLSGHLLGNSCPLGKQFVLIVFCLFVIFIYFPLLDQELISVRALVFDLAQLTFQKRFDCRNAIFRSSETFLDTS